jgi:hypothetical protein
MILQHDYCHNLINYFRPSKLIVSVSKCSNRVAKQLSLPSPGVKINRVNLFFFKLRHPLIPIYGIFHVFIKT